MKNLSQYSPYDIAVALAEAKAPSPFPSISNRDAWNDLRRQLGEDEVDALIANGERATEEPIPELTATMFVEFQRSGDRDGYQEPQKERRHLLAALAVAECLEDRGRFLDPILNLAWAICEESSWVMPAHQRGELTDIHRPVVDLGVAMTALSMAELAAVLGDRLNPLLVKRIHDEVERRCTLPYLSHNPQHYSIWWLYNSERRNVNNWTAVCNAGIVGAALHLEQDAARLAQMMTTATRSLDDYLGTFDADGGSSEGPGYWGFGFGYYALLAHLVEARSDGRISFLNDDFFRKVASFPLRTVLRPGVYANFSDCDADVVLDAPLLHYLADRLNLPDLHLLALGQSVSASRRDLAWMLRRLFWRAPADLPSDATLVPSAHDWFGEMMWMIGRVDPADPDALVLAAKGGHNGEMHNQNDVGNFIVHVNGESLVADVGRGLYTRDYFGPQRYEHFVNSSFGHSLPVPNERLQLPGAEYAAQLLEHAHSADADTLHLELKDAYPQEADLQSLQRRLTLHRAQNDATPQGWVELEDCVHFADGAGTFESALTTFASADVVEEAVIIRGARGALRIAYDEETVDARIELHKAIAFPRGPMDVQRISFTLKEPAQEATIRLELVPIS